MTRKSQREIERAVDDLGAPEDTTPPSPDLTEEEKEAIRAVCSVRRRDYPEGGVDLSAEDFLKEAEKLDGPHHEVLRDMFRKRRERSA